MYRMPASTYMITKYTRKQAKKLHVTVKRSTNPKKKLDVYKNGNKIASCGAIGYSDYPTYMRTKGITYAKKRRQLYKERHDQDRKNVGTAGYYADKLLW
jgi:hypothetical protein